MGVFTLSLLFKNFEDYFRTVSQKHFEICLTESNFFQDLPRIIDFL